MPPQVVAVSVKVKIKIKGEDNRDYQGGGSGTIVSLDPTDNTAVVLTCAHVSQREGTKVKISDEEPPPPRPMPPWKAKPKSPGKRGLWGTVQGSQVQTPDGQWHAGHHWESARIGDLAVIIFQGTPSTPVATVAEATPAIGTAVYQAGFPGMGPRVERAGRVLHYSDYAAGRPQLTVDFPVIGGDSGSGIFAADCKLVGVIWGTNLQAPQAIAVALPEIREFLEACKLPRPWKQPRPPQPGIPGQPQIPSPPLKPPDPGPGPYQPPIPQPQPGHLEDLRGKLDRLGQRLDGAEDRLRLIGQVAEGGANLAAKLRDRVEGVEGRIGALGRALDAGTSVMEKLKGRADQHEGRLGQLPVLDGLATLAPWLIGGGLLGGATPIVLLGLKALKVLRTMRRVRKFRRRQAGTDGSGNPILADLPEPIRARVVREVIRQEVPRTENRWIETKGPNEELEAYKRAIREIAEDDKRPHTAKILRRLEDVAKALQAA